jgi:WD40 repeat protein
MDSIINIRDIKTGQLLHTLEGHKTEIQSLDFSPDGSSMLSASKDGMVILWDVKDSKMIRILEGRKGTFGMSGAVFSPGGKQILAVSGDGSANVWDASKGNLIRTLEAKEGYSDFSGGGFTPDGKNIMKISERELKIWDQKTGNLLLTINTSGKPGICFSPDYQRILAVSNLKQSDGEYGYCVGLYDATNGRLLHIYDDPPARHDGIYYLGFTPDGKNIIAISEKCRIWDAETRNLVLVIDGNFDVGSTALFTSDGKQICLISGVSMGVYDRANGKLLHTYSPPSAPWQDIEARINGEKPVYLTVLSPNGKSFYISSQSSKSVKIYSTQNGELKQDLTGHSTPVTEAFISADGKNILSKYFYTQDQNINITKENFTAKVWDLKNGKILSGFKGSEWNSASFRDSDNIIRTILKSTSGRTKLNTWDAQTGNIINSVDLQADTTSRLIFSPDNNTVVAIDTNYIARILSTRTGEEIHKLTGSVAEAKYSPDNKSLVTTSWFDVALVWDVGSGTMKKFLRGKNENGASDSLILRTNDYDYVKGVSIVINDSVVITRDTPIDKLPLKFKQYNLFNPKKANFSNDGRYLITESTQGYSPYSIIWDFQDFRSLKAFWGNEAALDPEENTVMTRNTRYSGGMDTVTFSTYDIAEIWDIKGDTSLFRLKCWNKASYSPDGNYILTVYYKDSAKIWNAKNGQLYRAVYFSGTFCDMDWKNERMMIHDNSKLVLLDIRTAQELFSLIAIDSADYIVLTPDKYYMCSKNVANKLSWIVGDKLYSFDQFDLQYNRPDIVLERLGNPDTALIKMYRKAYDKRLKKAGFNEKMFSSEWHTPEIKILNSEATSNITDQSSVQLKICGTDSKYNLDRLLVWVNDVPVYGANGMSLIEEKTDSIVKTININLSAGNNNIKTSCINEKGVESLKESLDVIFNPQKTVKPDLYIIAMSVSDYKDNRYDLQYAAKDGKDIASLFSSLAAPEGGYGKVIIDTLFNKRAVRKNFFKLKQKLSASKVDDEVVVFVSGHGLLNKDMDFYFATYDNDFRNPEKRGISFDDLESILDGIPARKKLLMMDACHSGEVDKEETGDMAAANTASTADITFRGNVKEYNTRGNDTFTQPGITLNNSFELMQELFAGLDKGTGTTVISAAAGKGYALESPQWNNGVFTYSIINGLRNKAADKNKDGIITISELRDYSIRQVEMLTGGKQKPTARKGSINNDWRIW